MFSGWLFDAYAKNDKMVFWIRQSNGDTIRLEDDWYHPIYVATDDKLLFEQILANEEKSIFFNFIHAQTYFPIVKYFDHTKGLNWCSNQYGAAENHSMMTVTWIVNLPFTMTTIFRIKPCVA